MYFETHNSRKANIREIAKGVIFPTISFKFELQIDLSKFIGEVLQHPKNPHS